MFDERDRLWRELDANLREQEPLRKKEREIREKISFQQRELYATIMRPVKSRYLTERATASIDRRAVLDEKIRTINIGLGDDRLECG